MLIKPLQPRLVLALATLRAQVNDLFPGRPRHADGWIGDAAHAHRKSDHNPDHNGLVHALDLTDGYTEANCKPIAQYLLSALVRSRDPRIAYLIFNRQIWAGELGPKPWKPRPYKGVNPHTTHLHVSVQRVPELANDPRAWKL